MELSPGTNEPPAPAPLSGPLKKRSRNGKIARLPYHERTMVNRLLRNNIPYADIADALSYHNISVTERNISNWKTRGGYREWCEEQDRAVESRLRQDNLADHLRNHGASDLSEVGLQHAATLLSHHFMKPEVQQQLAADPLRFARTVSILCRLARQLHTLQRYRDNSAKELGQELNPERIRRKLEAVT